MFSFKVRLEEVVSVKSVSWAGLRICTMLLQYDPIFQNMPAGRNLSLCGFVNISDCFLTVKLFTSSRTMLFSVEDK